MTAGRHQPELRPDITFHPLGDAGALFDPVRRHVFTFGPAEAFAWCLLSETGDVANAAPALAAASGRPLEETQSWLQAALAQWFAAGLTGTPSLPVINASTASAAFESPVAVLPARFAVLHRYRILDLVIEVGFAETGIAAAADAVLLGLRTDLAPQVTAAVLRDGEGWVVIAEGRILEHAPRPAQAVPTLKLALTRLALSRASGFAAVHAAAVGRGGHAVLLPAPAGAGKSTLATGCVQAGWELVADDTVVLCAGPDEIPLLRPLPLALCLKPGSWAPLAGLGVDLDTLAVHERLDGKRARYLAPPRAADGPRTLAAIVVPRWRPGAEGSLRPLSAREAFDLLMPQLYPLTEPLDAIAVGRVAGLVERVPGFALDYDGLTDGIRLLAGAGVVP